MRRVLPIITVTLVAVLFPGAVAAQVELHVAHAAGLSEVNYSPGYSGPATAFLSLSGAEAVLVDADDVIHVGHGAGLSALVYDSGTQSYADATATAPFFGPLNVDGLVIDSNGVVHVLHAGGLSGLEFDFSAGAGAGYTDTKAFLSLPAPNLGLAVDPGDVLHPGHSAGLSATDFTPPSTYSSVAGQFFAIANVREVFVDSNDAIHAGHAAGLSALTYDGLSYADTGHFFALPNVNGVFEDPSGDLLVVHDGGLSAFSYGAGGYTARSGFSNLGGNSGRAVTMDRDRVVHVGHDAGVSAFTYDSTTGQFTDLGFFISIPGVRSLGLRDAQLVPVELMHFSVD
ncbi:MAG: hypothetical protein AAGM22_29740 [Acidobacteriota bacterium]